MSMPDVDAAVMFADIMTPVLCMGVGVELVEGVGPVVAQPVRTRADVDRIRVPEPGEFEQESAQVAESDAVVVDALYEGTGHRAANLAVIRRQRVLYSRDRMPPDEIRTQGEAP